MGDLFRPEEVASGVDDVTLKDEFEKIRDWLFGGGRDRNPEIGTGGRGMSSPSDIETGMASGVQEFRDNAPEGGSSGMEMDEGRNEWGAEVPVSGRPEIPAWNPSEISGFTGSAEADWDIIQSSDSPTYEMFDYVSERLREDMTDSDAVILDRVGDLLEEMTGQRFEFRNGREFRDALEESPQLMEVLYTGLQ